MMKCPKCHRSFRNYSKRKFVQHKRRCFSTVHSTPPSGKKVKFSKVYDSADEEGSLEFVTLSSNSSFISSVESISWMLSNDRSLRKKEEGRTKREKKGRSCRETERCWKQIFPLESNKCHFPVIFCRFWSLIPAFHLEWAWRFTLKTISPKKSHYERNPGSESEQKE